MRKLMETSREVGEEIARHCYTYDSIVQEYNTLVDTIPSRFVALIRGLQKPPYLEVGEEVVDGSASTLRKGPRLHRLPR